MARTNKNTSINFNEIYEKQLSSSPSGPKPGSSRPSTGPSAASSYSAASSRNAASNYKSLLTQGRMLVLSKPAPKPIAVPPPANPIPVPDHSRNEPEDSDQISLRPLGRTGGGSPLPSPIPIQEKDRELPPSLTSPKPNRFVPPHLRPGFIGKEERPEAPKQAAPRVRDQTPYGSPSPDPYGEGLLGRPKSGGGRVRRGGESDLSRAGSFGTRPSSSLMMLLFQLREGKFVELSRGLVCEFHSSPVSTGCLISL